MQQNIPSRVQVVSCGVFFAFGTTSRAKKLRYAFAVEISSQSSFCSTFQSFFFSSRKQCYYFFTPKAKRRTSVSISISLYLFLLQCFVKTIVLQLQQFQMRILQCKKKSTMMGSSCSVSDFTAPTLKSWSLMWVSHLHSLLLIAACVPSSLS